MKRLLILFLLLFAINTVIAQSTENKATIDQFGTNIARIEQIGHANTSDIDQGEQGTPVTNNKRPLYPTDLRGGAFINQKGNINKATIDVDGSNNGSDIYQLGDGNTGKQDINTSGSMGTNWVLMGVDLDQIGDDNYALQFTLENFGSAPVKGMFIKQEGNKNVATQVSVGGFDNQQNITQIGDNNNNPGQSGNILDVRITGLDNPLNLPWTFFNQGNITLKNDNIQYSNQKEGQARIYIEGDGNNTYQFQEYEIWGIGGRNYGNIDVNGDNNDIIQGQKGEYNNSDIDINGSENIVTSSQKGDFNMIDIDLGKGKRNNVVAVQQVGEWHSASVSQEGNSNFATIKQGDTP